MTFSVCPACNTQWPAWARKACPICPPVEEPTKCSRCDQPGENHCAEAGQLRIDIAGHRAAIARLEREGKAADAEAERLLIARDRLQRLVNEQSAAAVSIVEDKHRLERELAERPSREDWIDALSVIRSTVGNGPSVAWLGQRDALLKRVLR